MEKMTSSCPKDNGSTTRIPNEDTPSCLDSGQDSEVEVVVMLRSDEHSPHSSLLAIQANL